MNLMSVKHNHVSADPLQQACSE